MSNDLNNIVMKCPKIFCFLFLGGLDSTVSMEIPKIAGIFTGTGDVFSALVLAWMAKTGGDLKVSCIFSSFFHVYKVIPERQI